MKKIIFPLALVLFGFLSWACNSSSTPSNPNSAGPRGGNLPTLVPTPTFALTPPALVGNFATAFSPTGLAIAGGVTYVSEADDNGTELELLGSGTTSAWTTYGSSVTFQFLVGVANNSAGTTIYVLDNGDGTNDGTAAVYAFTGAGATITSWNSYGSTKLNNPNNLTVDALGNVYVADTGNNKVEEFGPAGSPSATWTGYNGTAFNEPVALAFDASGNFYVGDLGNGTVDEFSGTGVSGPSQTPANQWVLANNCYVAGLAIDGSGNLYVADYGQLGQYQAYFGNGLMEEYGPNGGPQLTAWSGTGSQQIADFGPDAVLLAGGSIWVADYNNSLIDQF